ncbi:MAG: helix-turn-helix transcriptional regulator [Candidatus Methylomirabilis oxygeniifera]|jgi:transcriptional regulator with XRE-family HTH domain|nr:MAG: helix-turn-helix transcriptional regulator [Candidatus Methylomirabilis oxyfera]
MLTLNSTSVTFPAGMAKKLTFGGRVRELRLAKKLSQRELAERVASRLKDEDRRGFDFTYLSKIENDRLPPPSTPAILALAAELGADSDELLALAGKPPPDVGDEFRKKEGARVFFRSATQQNLTEAEWQRLQAYLERMRKEGK